jgi:hypothetical protein
MLEIRNSRSSLTVERVESPEEVYLKEKRWIRDAGAEIPEDARDRPEQSWFVASLAGEPVGAIRLVYDPPLELPAELGVTLEPEVDLEGLKRRGRFVDIGRFMIVPAHRRNVRVVMRLMKAAIAEVVERGYTHFLTDVFEDDPHSPLQFHTRVLGFERIGTHRTGELACASMRIILMLDIGRAYQRLKRRRNKVFRELGEGLRDAIEGRLAPRSA